MKLTKKKLWIGGGYVVFMLLFFFIGIPKNKILDGFLGAVVMTAAYALIAWFINGIYEGSKPKP